MPTWWLLAVWTVLTIWIGVRAWPEVRYPRIDGFASYCHDNWIGGEPATLTIRGPLEEVVAGHTAGWRRCKTQRTNGWDRMDSARPWAYPFDVTEKSEDHPTVSDYGGHPRNQSE